MSTISEVFLNCRRDGRSAFIPFIAAGDPNLETTARVLQIVDRAGADIIELGVPFSDPIADGPIIQASYQRALMQGASLSLILERLSEIELKAPLVLFTYLNPVLQFGLKRLAKMCLDLGIAAVLVSDLTPEEAADYCGAFHGSGVDTVFLAAPTTTERRLKKILSCCSGFLYLISRTGVTGNQTILGDRMGHLIESVRKSSDIPLAVGFGMRTLADVRKASMMADGVVVGSAIVETLHEMVKTPGWETEFERYISQFAQATRLETSDAQRSGRRVIG